MAFSLVSRVILINSMILIDNVIIKAFKEGFMIKKNPVDCAVYNSYTAVSYSILMLKY